MTRRIAVAYDWVEPPTSLTSEELKENYFMYQEDFKLQQKDETLGWNWETHVKRAKMSAIELYIDDRLWFMIRSTIQ